MLPSKLQLFWPISFWAEFNRFFSIYSLLKLDPHNPEDDGTTWEYFHTCFIFSDQMVLDEKNFDTIKFLTIQIISPFKRVWSFIWTNLNPLHPIMLSAKFGWNWPSRSEEVKTVKSLQRTDRQMDKKWEKLTWAFS